MQQILLVIQILVAVGLVALVLLQQGRGADAGAAFGSGGAGSVFGARGPATLLTRMTAALAAVFFINSIGLAYMAREQSLATRSVMERRVEGTERTAPPADVPAPGAFASPESDVPAQPPGDGAPAPSGDGATN